MVSHCGAIGSSRVANGWNGNDPPAVVFTYAPPSRRMRAFACQATGRSGSHAMDILKGFNGILQGEEGQQTVRGTVCPTNGYTGYNALAEPRRVGGTPMTLACCWAHARRKLHDICHMDGSEIAAEGLRRIAFAHCPRTNGGQGLILQDRSQHTRSRTRGSPRYPPNAIRPDDRRLAATG